MIVSLMAFSVSAADANGNDWLDLDDYAEYSFSEDKTIVNIDCVFPTSWIETFLYDGSFSGSSFMHSYKGSPVDANELVDNMYLFIRPNAGNVMSGPEIGTQLKNAHIIDLTVLPKKTSFTTSFYITVDVDVARSDDFKGYQRLFFVDKDGKIVYKYNLSYQPKKMEYSSGQYVFTYEITTDLSNINLPDSVVGFIPLYELWEVFDNSMTYYLNSITYEPFSFFYSLSDLEYEVQQNTALKNTLKDVQSALADQDKKLDDLLTGGQAGEDLSAGGDKLEQAGSDMGDDLGQIQDFEDQYMGQLDDNMDDVIKGAELTWIYPALAFVQRYLNKIVAGIPSKYLIVFTLPMFFGLFMYIVGHPVRAPRPDTSGDQVTRETFTTTEILTGKGAGNVRTTRTTTTSREIGRVRDE